MVDHTFRIIDGGPPPEDETPKEARQRRLRRHAKPPSALRCHVCSSNAFVVLLLGPEISNGKVRGGQKQYICGGPCLTEGKHTVVF
jgi:hypothetical protein